MNTTTLKGVFPEPRPQPKRNFIKENMRHIKYLQGLLQVPEDLPRVSAKDNEKYRNVQPKVASQFTTRMPSKSSKTRVKDSSSQDSESQKVAKATQNKGTRQKTIGVGGKTKLEIKQLRDFGEITKKEDVALCQFNDKEKITHRGIQTERNEDMNRIYDCGVIKYPSPAVIEEINTSRRKPKRNDQGDSAPGSVIEEKHLSPNDKPDYIKQNINAIRHKTHRSESTSMTNTLPPNYQKGTIPKYLKERKEEQLKEVPADTECPPGHVLLPEEERKETLRVLRQSYADRIQELNSMPVRNDTLKMRKRKMELEEELKKIDEGIKVFQRPKVFVKVNA